MADHRDYISRSSELGSVHISGEVLAVIAAAAALEVEGVAALSSNLGGELTELSGKRILARGVRLRVEGNAVTVDVSILLKYGYTVPDTARQVQQSVQAAISATSGLTVLAVNLHIAGVVFPREKK